MLNVLSMLQIMKKKVLIYFLPAAVFSKMCSENIVVSHKASVRQSLKNYIYFHTCSPFTHIEHFMQPWGRDVLISHNLHSLNKHNFISLSYSISFSFFLFSSVTIALLLSFYLSAIIQSPKFTAKHARSHLLRRHCHSIY